MTDLALRMMFHDRLRLAITVAGVGFAVALVIVQIGMFAGLLDNASVLIDEADADLWITSRNTPNVDFAHPFPDSFLQRVRSVPGVARADNLIVWFVMTMLPNGTEDSVVLWSAERPTLWNVPAHVTSGNVEDVRRGNYFLLDQSAVRRQGAFSVGEYREIAGKRMQIIGTTRGAKSFTTTPALRDAELARAREGSARAALQRLNATLQKSVIVSPIDGVVIDRAVEAGEAVDAGSPIAAIVNPSALRLDAEVDELDVARIEPGAPVRIAAEGFDRQWTGRVVEIPMRVVGRSMKPTDPAAPVDTRVLMVGIEFLESTPLKLGQRVDVTIGR